MFTHDQEKFLLRRLNRAELVLFAGAGFSRDAANRLGQPIPTGPELAARIWEFLAFDGEYDGTPLDQMYAALVGQGLTLSKIRMFLESNLTCGTVPDIYSPLTRPIWRRIYTTNVDDLIDTVYKKQGSRIEILAFPQDEVEERDQSLSTIQVIHLNGRLPCSPEDITFSPRQYASAGVRSQPLYDMFVRDFATHPVLFVGTELNEPLFWQALESRRQRLRDTPEQRPQSFLVAPNISQAKRIQLKGLNVEPVLGTTAELAAWVRTVLPSLDTRSDVLRRTAPNMAAVLETRTNPGARVEDVTEFSRSFGRVPTERPVKGSRSMYLLGAAPRWEDFFNDLDAARDLSPTIRAFVEKELSSPSPRLRVGAILGSAGSGKSTILRRLGLQLAQAGRTVFLTNSERLPPPELIRRVTEGFTERVVLLFDNAEVGLSQLPILLHGLLGSERPPVVLLASRTNDFDRLWARTDALADLEEFQVPHLSLPEIRGVIDVLEREHLLGELRGLSEAERIEVFEQKAKKQILVAMREATTSRGFDLIIRDEFDKLVPEDSKHLYLCIALATDAGYRLTREEVVGCSSDAPAEALDHITRNLKDVVITTGASNDLFLLRHRLIAEVAVNELAPRPLLRKAYCALLAVLAPEARAGSWRARSAGLVQALNNHRTIYGRFRDDIDEARSVFVGIREWYRTNAHYWLQFGSLELEGAGGDLTLAENYLRQAESLRPGDSYILNALGHLHMKRAILAVTLEEAIAEKNRATEILQQRVENTNADDVYAVHILGSNRYHWMKRWLAGDDAATRRELDELRKLIQTACDRHPKHRRLAELKKTIERAALEMVVSPGQRRPLPELGPLGG